jgi:uncharacterized membrane protein
MNIIKRKLLFCRLARSSLPLALMLTAGGATAVTYTATSLAELAESTTMVIRGPNGHGTAVGGGKLVGSDRSISARKGLILSSGQLTRVDGFVNSDYTNVMDVNDDNDFVGSANTDSGLKAFRGGKNGSTVLLPGLPGDSASTAYAMNNQGLVAGFSSGPNGERAVKWTKQNDVMPLAGKAGSNSRALGINNRGDVVGFADSPSGHRATLWLDNGVSIELPMLPTYIATEAYSINNSGDSVGFSETADGFRLATLWPAQGGSQSLGVLPGGAHSQAYGVNARGDIVGSSSSSKGNRAVIWPKNNGVLQDLNTMLSVSGIVLTKAVGINSNGVIVAIGRTVQVGHEDHESHDHEAPARVFLLSPN